MTLRKNFVPDSYYRDASMLGSDGGLARYRIRISPWLWRLGQVPGNDLSLIETPENLLKLSARLAAWCIVEAGGQRFNFRFPDTRRLPAIFRTLHPLQRASFVGPMKR